MVAGAAGRDPDLAWRALADPNRRAILTLIRLEPRAVGEVAEAVGLSQQAASHHLAVLHRAGLAVSRRESTRHLFAVNTDGLAAVRSYLDDFWPGALQGLKRAAEREAVRRSGSHGAPRSAGGRG